MTRFALLPVLVAGALLSASPASAQNTTNPAAAESLFQEAEKLETAGNFDLACTKYAESQQLDPGLGTLLHLAQCYEKAGKTASAWGRYREAMELAVRAGDQRSEIARKRAEKLEPMLSKLTISVTPQNQVTGLAVARDGVAVGPAQWNLAIPVDPGEHTVVATAAGYLPTQVKVVTPPTAAAQKVEIPRLTLDPKGAKAADEDPSRGNTQRIVGITLAGTGAAALIVGGILGIAAKSAYDKSDAFCVENTCQPDGITARDNGYALATPATILVGVGAGLVAAGAVVYFIAPRSRKDTAGLQAPRVGFGPTGFVVRGSF